MLANTLTVCKLSYEDPHAPGAFENDRFNVTVLFSGLPRAGLSQGETALLRLTERGE